MIPPLLPGIRSHHAESTCLGSSLPQEFSLASYEKHCFNWQMLRQDGVRQTAEEGENIEKTERRQTALQKPYVGGVLWQFCKDFKGRNIMESKCDDAKRGRWEISARRNQMRESLSLHPVAWAMSAAETMTQRWLRTGCLCGGQGSAEGWKGSQRKSRVRGRTGMTNFQIQGTLLGCRIKPGPEQNGSGFYTARFLICGIVFMQWTCITKDMSK